MSNFTFFPESVILLGKKYKDRPLRKYLPYTLTEKPWLMMERKQFAAHLEKAKQEKCEKLNKLAKVHGAKVVPMTEWEEEVAPLSEKAAKFGAKVVPLTKEKKEAEGRRFSI